MDITETKTERGFELLKFVDLYGVECSLQASSLATDNAIWLGCSEPNPKVMLPGLGWNRIDLPDNVSMTTRMHLNREQVKALLPYLQRFVETGDLY